jgi:[acyl-carrier-protein] S-malonyltransferase
MSGAAFVFPGQGSQCVGMGKELSDHFPEAREVFQAAEDALGEKLSRLCFEGPEDALRLTANTQPAILTVSVAAYAVLAKRVPPPAAASGHSLGEYSALVAAGAIGIRDAVLAVRARGQLMQQAVPEGVGAMAAVIGLPPEVVKSICEQLADGQVLAPANYNSPEQTVIAGHAEAVARAEPKLKQAGAKRVLRLAVSAPFHCALMESVKPKLAEVLRAIHFKSLKFPVISNVEATANGDRDRVVPLLIEQVSRPVRWTDCVHEIERLGIKTVVEVGPGKVLSGLVKRISKSLSVVNIEDCRTAEQFLDGARADGRV